MTKRCLIPGCKKGPLYAKGLCHPCYQSAKRRVDLQKNTWDELVDMGLALPSHKSPFQERFESIKKGRKP